LERLRKTLDNQYYLVFLAIPAKKAGLHVKGPYLFAPHFPRTLVDLNNGPAELIADHSPMTVDLPFHEPVKATNVRHE
jgi:hypothetical protein